MVPMSLAALAFPLSSKGDGSFFEAAGYALVSPPKHLIFDMIIVRPG
jgi:hypothetical protein